MSVRVAGQPMQLSSQQNLIKTSVSAAHRSQFLSSRVSRGRATICEPGEESWSVSNSNFSRGSHRRRAFDESSKFPRSNPQCGLGNGAEAIAAITDRRGKTYSRRLVVCVADCPTRPRLLLLALFLRPRNPRSVTTDTAGAPFFPRRLPPSPNDVIISSRLRPATIATVTDKLRAERPRRSADSD